MRVELTEDITYYGGKVRIAKGTVGTLRHPKDFTREGQISVQVKFEGTDGRKKPDIISVKKLRVVSESEEES